MTIKDRSRLSSNDHFSQKARKDGFPARSVYKLEEIDKKYKILAARQHVLDLGCSPGSWSLYASQKVGYQGLVVGLDINPASVAEGPFLHFRQADLLDDPTAILRDGEAPFEVILSDMAPKTTGRRDVDQARSLELVEMAWLWAERYLKRNGHFLCKIFQSQEAEDFIKTIKPKFNKIVRLKPEATRSQSYEFFLLGIKYLGEPTMGEVL